MRNKAVPRFLSFYTHDQLIRALGPAIGDSERKRIISLTDAGLAPITSPLAMAVLMGISPRMVNQILKSPARYYRVFQIRKGTKLRTIEAPRVVLKSFQRWILSWLEVKADLGDCVHGFRKTRSTLTATIVHSNSKWVASVDIADFFHSISHERVVSIFLGFGYSIAEANLLSKLCCLDGRLSQGSPLSPLLANIAFSETDKKLTKIAESTGNRYTRYADDITFSGISEYPANLLDSVTDTILHDGWKLAEGKVVAPEANRRMKVHGLIVSGEKPRLTKGYRKRIRALRHLLNVGKVTEENRPKVLGHLAYAYSVERLDPQGRNS